jgi:hypothetical protein
MDDQQPAIYLTCIKNRGFQKKHIEVCKKCSTRDGCKEYQAHRLERPAQPKSDEPLPEPVEALLVDIIRQLTEIKEQMGDGKPTSKMDNPAHMVSLTRSFLTHYLKVELEGIRSLCTTPD